MSASLTQPDPATIEYGAARAVLRGTLATVAVAVVAAVINILIGRAALALGASPDVPALGAAAIATVTTIGAVLATLGWATIRRVARRPRGTLIITVPVVTVLSLGADIALLIMGTSALAVGALMIMHLVVAAVAVLALRVALPVPGSR